MTRTRTGIVASVAVLALLVTVAPVAIPQNAIIPGEAGGTANASFAEEEFRRGVQSFYRGAFNEAIILFERALSYLPGEGVILDWLGMAYYRAGIEGTALLQWEYAVDAGYGGLLLQNKIDIVRSRRLTDAFRPGVVRYTEAGSFPGMRDKTMFFSQPVSLLPNPDSTCWVLAYSSNELLRIDLNGYILDRIRGPLTGFDRPMDIARMKDGHLVVSEYFGDRVSLLSPAGQYLRSFGGKGRGAGQFVGPQYLALDAFDNVYVTDFGNARVVVLDRDGNPLLSFGQKTDAFPGFRAPTGIAVIDDTVFVADAVSGAIYRFDTAGNYLGLLVPDKTCARPEAMRPFGDYLLLADSNRMLSIDTVNGIVFENGRTGNAPSRITCAAPDVNGNLMVSDFRANEIYVMTRTEELAGGLFVQIERVIADAFPTVTLELSVENRRHEPIIGLQAQNFLITEEKRPVAAQTFVGAAANNETCDITLLIDRSLSAVRYADAINSAVRELAAAMDGRGTLRLVAAGYDPITEYHGAPSGVRSFAVSMLKTPVSEHARLDNGIRLAANDLMNGEAKRAIVFITAGSISEGAFERYGLTNLTAYLNNNHIGFYTVSVAQGALPSEVAYITARTAGTGYYLFRPEGLAPIIRAVLDTPVGIYRFTYTSSLPTNFGRAFLPVEAEVYMLNRSGRDEAGYFTALQ